MAQSVEDYEKRIMIFLNDRFPNDTKNIEKIEHLQSVLNSNIHDDDPYLTQSLINVLNKFIEENIISISEPVSEPISDPVSEHDI